MNKLKCLRWISTVALAALMLAGRQLWRLNRAVRAAPAVIYVDVDAPSPAHDGQSWPTAFTNVQDALVAASYGDEIWVAEGVYYPDEGAGQTDGDRYATFMLVSGVGLYGGFAGTETARAQRDWTAHVAILSGDIGGDDRNTDGNRIAETWTDLVGDNLLRVVSSSGVTETARLDGFTITAGNDTGVYNDAGSPTLANLTISGQWVWVGGGVHNEASSPTLINVTISGNRAWDGGGMANYNHSRPTLINVTFSNNWADHYGGGMYNQPGHPILNNVIFSGNRANAGGGMANIASSPTLVNVTFSGNLAHTVGGGMYNEGSTPTLVNTLLWGNAAWGSAPELCNRASSVPAIGYSDIAGSGGSGGGWDTALGRDDGGNLDADPQFIAPVTAPPTTVGDYRLRCGSPVVDAGATLSVTVAVDQDGAPRIVGAAVDMGAYEEQISHHGVCLSIHKRVTPAQAAPGAVITYTLTFTNHAAAALTPPQVVITDAIPVSVTVQSVVSSGAPITLTGTPPVYVWQVADLAPGQSGVITLTAVLNPALPFLATVVNTAVITSAVAADAPYDNRSTAGVQLPGVLYYVDADAPGPAHDGLAWTTAFTTVQDALATAVYGDEIWVAEGVYYPDEGAGQSDGDRDAAFALADGVGLYGGFAGTETERAQRDWTMHVTILSGDIGGDDADADSNAIAETWADIQGDNAYHVVVGNQTTPAARLDGFTVTAGSADGRNPRNSGGGMYNDNSRPTLSNVAFSGNQASGDYAYGGGMYNQGSDPLLTNVIFSGNRTHGLYVDRGGGLCNVASNPRLINVLFSDNQAVRGGGIANYANSDLTLSNVTISGNHGVCGGGMYNQESSPTLVNCILWDNMASLGPQFYNDGSSIPVVSYSDVQGSDVYPGVGNINADPRFAGSITGTVTVVLPPTRAYRLHIDSPAIDAGNNFSVTVESDLGGGLRFVDNPNGVDTGIGTPPIVDMGAYEWYDLYPLTVILPGNGRGRVVSTPPGISCPGSQCKATFFVNTVITLTAQVSDPTSISWNNVASGTAQLPTTVVAPTTVVRMDRGRTIMATFRTYKVYLPVGLVASPSKQRR